MRVSVCVTVCANMPLEGSDTVEMERQMKGCAVAADGKFTGRDGAKVECGLTGCGVQLGLQQIPFLEC